MGGLADIGRARPFSGLTGNILEGSQGLLKTQMAMDRMDQDRRSREIEDRLNTIKLNEAQAASERDNRLIDLDEIPTKFEASGQGEFGKAIHGYIKATGTPQEVVAPDGSKKYFVRKGDVKHALNEYPKIMDKYPDFAKSMLWASYSDANTQLEALQQKATKAKPEEVDALKQQIEAAKGKRDGALKSYNAFSGKDKGSEPFTLGPGQKRFDAQGNEIAEGGNDVAERRLEETERANRAREDAMDKRLGIMEKNAETTAKKAMSQGKELSFADKEALRAMGKQLPKSKVAAETAVKNLEKIDRMMALIDKGAGGVKGELLAKINKVTDILRRTSPEDAKYNTLKAELRGFAGTLRLQLGLVGQTSDRDVAIMYESAGGNSPAESQKAILSGYRQGYEQDVTNYNSDAEAYAGYSSAGKNLYRPIPLSTNARSKSPTVVETRKTKDGRTLEKLSDGTIREAK